MSQMLLESVNVGQPVALDAGRPDKRTGICKQSVAGAVRVHGLGLEGDAVVDTRHHGGPGQALYLYSREDYAFWAARDVATGPGMFGENLTVSGIESADLCIGDRLAVGDVVLEVTSSRIPCATFARRMGDPGFVKKFRDAGRPGAYLRVVAEGYLEAGQAIELIPFAGDRISLGEHFALVFMAMKKPLPREMITRLLALPLAERDRADNLERLAAL
ncbi:MOSC domain-containing protein [Pelagibacterium nitratireducens]|uniref:MOSC domain-containing protein n=1 Tax=Pelagibacterium nitratireducens TaxID=1046114 RepID=A0ABZ2I922_9HYPH